ncbi:MAG: ribonuclease P protein component [Bacteroidales bacterium]|jgi:ribonuclease P protein component|nr:ribonuclease P protein component [Bacteroidales bacterium]MDD4384688.1 ribonuclease P protein component [Bacteroidales bacterium]MDY0197057.1 ribonuclease P protein component [Tenuifilaceae bacterium]
MKPFGFPKQEKLCSKRSTDVIFSTGTNLFCYPYKVLYLSSPIDDEVAFAQVMFVVQKKRFKRAVDRNAIRRRMREAYRLNKHLLKDWCEKNNTHIKLVVIYVASQPVDLSVHQKAIQCVFSSIIKT